MSLKAALQIELCNRFEEKFGLCLYKIIITRVLVKMCTLSFEFNIDDDLKMQMIKKLARRLYKLKKMDYKDIIEPLNSKANIVISKIHKMLEFNFIKVIQEEEKSLVNLDPSKFNHNSHIHNLDEIIKNFFEGQKLNSINMKEN